VGMPCRIFVSLLYKTMDNLGEPTMTASLYVVCEWRSSRLIVASLQGERLFVCSEKHCQKKQQGYQQVSNGMLSGNHIAVGVGAQTLACPRSSI